MKKYNFLGYSKNKKFCIKGIDVFRYHWIMLGTAVVVINPSDNRPMNISAYKIDINNRQQLLFSAKQMRDGEYIFFDYN